VAGTSFRRAIPVEKISYSKVKVWAKGWHYSLFGGAVQWAKGDRETNILGWSALPSGNQRVGAYQFASKIRLPAPGFVGVFFCERIA